MDALRAAEWCIFLACLTATAQEVPTSPPQVYRLGPEIAPPFVVAKVKPDYTDEARLAKLEGSVLLSVVVDAGGAAGDIHVDRALGLGLDESAIENVRHWQFRAGTKAGSAVAVRVNEEVFFRTQRTLWDWHAVRAVFFPPEGARRPVLIQTKFPVTVDEEENASVTITFDVGRNGIPVNASVVKSSNPKWEKDLLTVLQTWRFRPGLANGKPTVVRAGFEFVRGSHSPTPPVPFPTR